MLSHTWSHWPEQCSEGKQTLPGEALSALISLNGPDQPHLRLPTSTPPPPPWALLKLSLRLLLLSCAVLCWCWSPCWARAYPEDLFDCRLTSPPSELCFWLDLATIPRGFPLPEAGMVFPLLWASPPHRALLLWLLPDTLNWIDLPWRGRRGTHCAWACWQGHARGNFMLF